MTAGVCHVQVEGRVQSPRLSPEAERVPSALTSQGTGPPLLPEALSGGHAQEAWHPGSLDPKAGVPVTPLQ